MRTRTLPLLSFKMGAGAACTKHLSRLSRREAAAAGRKPRSLETILCPHAVPFKGLTRRWPTFSYCAGSGEGQSSYSRSPRSWAEKGARAGVQSHAWATGPSGHESRSALRRMGLPAREVLLGSAFVAPVGRTAHPLSSSRRHKALQVEGRPPLQNVVDHAAQLRPRGCSELSPSRACAPSGQRTSGRPCCRARTARPPRTVPT